MRLCPCGTNEAYSACCAPLHRGQREARDPTELMRSRFAAFAFKEHAYLWRTLHESHEDRARPEQEVLRELRAAWSAQRYLGLTILDASGPDEAGLAHVMFAARVFRRGQDISFTERSAFRHDGVGWRYVSGELTPNRSG